jgi:hypothetical protein
MKKLFSILILMIIGLSGTAYAESSSEIEIVTPTNMFSPLVSLYEHKLNSGDLSRTTIIINNSKINIVLLGFKKDTSTVPYTVLSAEVLILNKETQEQKELNIYGSEIVSTYGYEFKFSGLRGGAAIAGIDVLIKKLDYNYKINKGWNLVSPSILENIPTFEEDKLFLFNNIDKKYYSINDFFDLDYFSENYLFTSAGWYYSDENQVVEIDNYIEDSKELNSLELNQGWNLISISSLMVDINLNEFFDKSCRVEKVYFYNSEKQSWIKVPLYEAFTKEKLGFGIAVKTLNDCEINFKEESISPPSIPISNEETPTEEETKEFGLQIIENILENDCESFANKIYFKNNRDYNSKEDFLEKDSLGKRNGLCNLKEEIVEGEISFDKVKSDKRYRAEDIVQLRTMGSLLENYGVDNSNLYGFIINGVEESEDYYNYELKPVYFLFKKIDNKMKIVYFEN